MPVAWAGTHRKPASEEDQGQQTRPKQQGVGWLGDAARQARGVGKGPIQDILILPSGAGARCEANVDGVGAEHARDIDRIVVVHRKGGALGRIEQRRA